MTIEQDMADRGFPSFARVARMAQVAPGVWVEIDANGFVVDPAGAIGRALDTALDRALDKIVSSIPQPVQQQAERAARWPNNDAEDDGA